VLVKSDISLSQNEVVTKYLLYSTQQGEGNNHNAVYSMFSDLDMQFAL
jgi:hypothetical protein